MRRIGFVGVVAMFLVFAQLGALSAQGGGFGKITGRVVDAKSHPIANATVSITGTNLRARADAQGAYSIDSIPAGVVQLDVRYIAFKPVSLAGLRITAGQTVAQLDFKLEPSPVTLREVSVTPTLLLRFQLIGPTATRTTDKALMPIDSVLHELFQWTGYKLLAQSALNVDMPMTVEWGGTGASSQTQTMLNVDGQSYDLSVRVDTTMASRVKMTVSLVGLTQAAATKSTVTSQMDRKVLLSTTVTVSLGRTVVLGSTQPGGGRGGMAGTLILTVSPVSRPPN